MVIPSDAVSIVGIGQVPVLREHELSLRQLGTDAVHRAMADAGIDHADALFVGNMLADELQGQKHLATLIADEAGLRGIEALQVRAATATGAAALRMAYLAVASGQAEVAVALGVEKMSSDRSHVVSSLAKALDAELEVPTGATLLSQNAMLMALYLERYGLSIDDFDGFALNAHANANHNPNALFHDRTVTAEQVDASPIVSAPPRWCSPAPGRPKRSRTGRWRCSARVSSPTGSASKTGTTRCTSPRPPVRCGMPSGAPMCTVVTSASSKCTTPSRS